MAVQMIQECDEQREHCSKSAMMTMEPEFIIQTSPGTERTLQDSTQLQKAVRKSNSSTKGWFPNAIFKKKKGFTDCCMELYREFENLHKVHGELIISTKLWKDVKQIKANLVQERKDISIGVFGQHNCGKSTLINAMIGDSFLPVLSMNCTAVRVKIQHEGSIHPGSCSDVCQQQLMQSCPQLLERGHIVAIGRSSIRGYLKHKNEEARQKLASPLQCTEEAMGLLLQVSIPMLENGVPLDWKVSLMDNPGFGETREHITHLADISMAFSSAYIYLVQMENIGGTEAAKFFIELDKIDRAAIGDGRLIIGITKFDKIYEDDDSVTVEMVKQEVIQCVKAKTGVSLPEDVVIPLCGKWALRDSKLIHQLNTIIDSEDHHLPPGVIQKVIAALERDHVPLPVGQGQSQEDAIAKLGPKEIVKKLEEASGISSIRARIQDVVGKACVITWSKKIYTQLINYAQDTIRRIDSMCSVDTKKKNKKDLVYKDRTGLHEEIQKARRDMVASAATGRTMKSTAAWKNLMKNYCLDVQVSESPALGKERTELLIGKFRRKCKEKFEAGELSSTDFELSVQDFLIECQPKLQKVFDTCRLQNTERSLALLNEQTVQQLAFLKENAKKLVGNEPSDFLTSSECAEYCGAGNFSRNNEVLTSDKFVHSLRHQLATALTKAEQAEASCRVNEHKRALCAQSAGKDQSSTEVTNLGHLSSTGSVPSVSLPWWRKIISFIRKLVGATSDGYSESALSDAAKALHFDSAILKSYVVIDCQLSISDTPGINHRPIKQPPLAEKEDNDIVSECDDSSTTITSPKKWVDERLLDETIDFVQKLMEEECDQYFERIETEAIKHFYDKYCSKIKDGLQKFDDEFKDRLEEKVYQLQQNVTFAPNKHQQIERPLTNNICNFQGKSPCGLCVTTVNVLQCFDPIIDHEHVLIDLVFTSYRHIVDHTGTAAL